MNWRIFKDGIGVGIALSLAVYDLFESNWIDAIVWIGFICWITAMVYYYEEREKRGPTP